MSLSGVDLGEMWLAKVARRGENLVQYLKIPLDIVLDAKTFVVILKQSKFQIRHLNHQLNVLNS